jgi:hypothetical protein
MSNDVLNKRNAKKFCSKHLHEEQAKLTAELKLAHAEVKYDEEDDDCIEGEEEEEEELEEEFGGDEEEDEYDE